MELRILEFKTENMAPARAAAVIRLIKDYNEFRGDDVADALTALDQAGRLEYVVFGREGSPVLYMLPNMKDLAESKEKVREAMHALGADEIDDDGPYLIRAWWD